MRRMHSQLIFFAKRNETNKQKQKFLAMVVRRPIITAKVSHQNWCKVLQQKPWSYVVRQSPQKFHTSTGAKFHSKSHGRMSSDNHRKSFTPELVQSFTAKAFSLEFARPIVFRFVCSYKSTKLLNTIGNMFYFGNKRSPFSKTTHPGLCCGTVNSTAGNETVTCKQNKQLNLRFLYQIEPVLPILK